MGATLLNPEPRRVTMRGICPSRGCEAALRPSDGTIDGRHYCQPPPGVRVGNFKPPERVLP